MKHVLLGLMLVFTSGCIHADNIPISASSALVIDADTNEVLLNQADTDVRPIASITKLMTAVVIMSSDVNLNEIIKISRADVDGTKLRGKATSSPLSVGMRLTRRELLRLALMSSNNRAAYALARSYPGGVSAFVKAMNCKAVELGMINTKFTDPTGLQNLNVSTASDLTLLVKAASEYDAIREFSTLESVKLPVTKKRFAIFGTTNRLVRSRDWNIMVQKTGFINDAGRCVVMMANIAARKVIIILLNAPGNNQRAADANAIRHWLEQQ